MELSCARVYLFHEELSPGAKVGNELSRKNWEMSWDCLSLTQQGGKNTFPVSYIYMWQKGRVQK